MVRFAFGRKTPKPETADETSALPPTSDVGLSAAQSTSNADLVDLLEEDIRRSRQQADAANATASGRIEDGVTLSRRVMDDADQLAASIVSAAADVDALSDAFHDVTRTGHDITTDIRAASDLARGATEAARAAGDGVNELMVATERIEAVVGLIAKVAKQTNLLALNATIEAERAGAAGRGFAVVAQEVKSLSTETQKATDEIARTIAALQDAAMRSGTTVGNVVSIIDEIQPRFDAVAAAVESQGSNIDRAADRAQRVRAFVGTVSARADAMRSGSAEAASAARQVKDVVRTLGDINGRTATRLTTLLRQAPGADRRRHDRFPVTMPATLEGAGLSLSTETIDLSMGGVLVKARDTGVRTGTRLNVDLSGIGRLPGWVVAVSGLGLHIAFEGIDASSRARIGARVAAIQAEYQPLIDRATQAAAQIGTVFDQAVDRHEITVEDLFDTDYRPIPGTDPAQVETRNLAFLERVLVPLQEAVVASDPRMAFAACVDRNGYLPVHNLVFSKPQRPGDPVWNAANSRNRRIFDDRTGLLAARNTRPFLIQAYDRDMGNGVIVLMKEVDAPIVVKGRHWGGFRTAYKL